MLWRTVSHMCISAFILGSVGLAQSSPAPVSEIELSCIKARRGLDNIVFEFESTEWAQEPFTEDSPRAGHYNGRIVFSRNQIRCDKHLYSGMDANGGRLEKVIAIPGQAITYSCDKRRGHMLPPAQVYSAQMLPPTTDLRVFDPRLYGLSPCRASALSPYAFTSTVANPDRLRTESKQTTVDGVPVTVVQYSRPDGLSCSMHFRHNDPWQLIRVEAESVYQGKPLIDRTTSTFKFYPEFSIHFPSESQYERIFDGKVVTKALERTTLAPAGEATISKAFVIDSFELPMGTTIISHPPKGPTLKWNGSSTEPLRSQPAPENISSGGGAMRTLFVVINAIFAIGALVYYVRRNSTR